MSRSARIHCIITSALCASLALTGCKDERERPNVVLISIDTLRADHLGVYGHGRETSPTIDALAAQAVRFEQAIAQAGWTLPSHMSLMTSLYPGTHGVTTKTALASDVTTLAESLNAAGYRTAAFVSWVFLDKKFGFGQGFEQFRILVREGRVELGSGGGARSAEEVVDRAIDYLGMVADDPIFLFVHLFDPHADYAAPAQYVERFAGGASGVDGRFETLRAYNRYLTANPQRLRGADLEHVEALYDAEIRYVDDQLARLLAAVDARLGLDDSLIVLTSDHGEEFMDHGSMEGHGWTLYEEIVRVPLLIRLPNAARAGTVVEAPVGLIDVAPSVLDWLGVEIPSDFEGTSLRPLLLGDQSTREPRYVFSENDRFNVVRRSVRGPRYKLIFTEAKGVNAAGIPVRAGYEMYDLMQDPAEQHDLYDPDDPRSKALIGLLEGTIAPSTTKPPNPEVDLSQEQLRLLRSLGYVE
ncbi:MAG: sulfatase-like hydrolase/transferase [bacterium]|nr:sulfatase-like hydrolase/transferase [bacterium]